MTNTLKLADEFNRYFTSSNGVDVPERVSVSRDEWRQLHAALHAYGHATQPAEVTDRDIERVFADHGLVTTKRSMRATRAILALRPQASPDGRGTDAQILKEREIARHAIDGAIAAGYAGATHPGADHWLAAAHNAGMRIAELERAMTPVPCNTFLVRDVAELLGCSVPDVCTAFVQLGRGNRSTNMAITPDEALSVARHLALRPAQVPMTWPKARDVGRFGDMSPSAHMRVGLDGDNDVYVSVWDEKGGGCIEFCTPGPGGGSSSRTRQALIALMVAMEADNAERPDKDWWARRMGAITAQAKKEDA